MHASVLRTRIGILVVLLALVSCEDEVSSPPPPSPETTLHVELIRNGDDVDASVFVPADVAFLGFEWQLTDEHDRLARSVPPRDDQWRFVSGEVGLVGAVFARHGASADVDRVRLWVRSVREDGMRDDTPAFVTITRAGRLVPDVVIDFPEFALGTGCARTATMLTLGWSIEGLRAGDRVSTRHAWVRTGALADPCLTRAQIEALDLASMVPEEAWSAWRTYEPGAPLLAPSRSTTLDALARPDGASGDSYLFLVQARDDAGDALSRTFDFGRNVFHARAEVGHAPTLTVVGADFAVRTFDPMSAVVTERVPAGVELAIDFLGSAAAYTGHVRGYRWGIDVDDPDDAEDDGWQVPWQVSTDVPAPRPPTLRWTTEEGSRRLVFAVMDQAGGVTRAVFDLDVFAPTPWELRRPLLLVEDVGDVAASLRTEWTRRWVEHLGAIVPGFDPELDVVDAATEADVLDAERVFGYRGVVWFVHRPEYLPTRLVRAGAVQGVNWLALFQRQGNLLLVGSRAAAAATEGHFARADFRAERPPSNVGTRFVAGADFPWGARQWIHRGFGVQTVRAVDVFDGSIPYEPEQPCEGLVRADVAASLMETFPTASALVDWTPVAHRIDPRIAGARLDADGEEQYDLTACCGPLPSDPVLVPMFVHRARRDLYPEAITSACPTPVDALTGRSVLDGAMVGVVSLAHTPEKMVEWAVDALWGMHPMGFEDADLRPALAWLIGDNWRLGAPAP